MINLKGVRVGYALTGSFCTFSNSIQAAKTLSEQGAVLTPIFSEHAATIDTRFGKAADHLAAWEQLCGNPAICSIADAEPLGPKNMLDLLVVAPCTANTMAKLALGITDTTVTMAVKSMLRNQKPIVLCLATNDALRASAKNLGLLLNTKHYYFVPLVADFKKLPQTVALALEDTQIQPILIPTS